MSRIGKKPIGLPKEATAIIEDSVISIEGPKGKLYHQIPEGVTIEITDDSILINRNSDERRERSLHGLTRTLVATPSSSRTRPSRICSVPI